MLAEIAKLGWPVAPALEESFGDGQHTWTLFPFLPGESRPDRYSPDEQRTRGRLLAEFHFSLAQLPGVGQRGTWRRGEEILADESLDATLAGGERQRPEEMAICRWHLARARERAAGIELKSRPGLINHGDFAPWNLLFQNGQLSGILDFELAHWDHRAAEFNYSWRGRYDGVIHGYNEVSPLEPEEWEMIVPLWWANLVDLACRMLRRGMWDDDWVVKKLLERTEVMREPPFTASL